MWWYNLLSPLADGERDMGDIAREERDDEANYIESSPLNVLAVFLHIHTFASDTKQTQLGTRARTGVCVVS